MTSKDATQPYRSNKLGGGGTCPGSHGPGANGRFPGDSDRCPVCGSLVRVLESTYLAKHRQPKTSRRASYA